MGVVLNKIELPFSSKKIRVAFVQFDGPLPHAKTLVAYRGRETYEWKSLDVVNQRVGKAIRVLEHLGKKHEDVDVVVFPEYSLPSYTAERMLRPLADRYGFCVIAGADNVMQDGGTEVLNQCPVLVPGRETVWVAKRRLSKWEVNHVDAGQGDTENIFYWSVGDKKYYLSIKICMDFLHSLGDETSSIEDPLIYMVPMSSPDMLVFNTYADTMLFSDYGRAVLLCNTTAKTGGAGYSSVFVLTPTGERLQPAITPLAEGEGVCLTTIDMSRLTPPRRSQRKARSAVGSSTSYRILTSPVGVEVEPINAVVKGRKSRAVLNPSLFAAYGKRLRMTFVGVDEYGRISEEDLEVAGFEAYSVLGASDMMITHLHSDANTMIIDIHHAIPWKLSTGENGLSRHTVDNSLVTSFPYFTVDTFYKVLGEPVDEIAKNVFDEGRPSGEELAQLVALSGNWNARVPDSAKKRFLKKRWILARTSKTPGKIRAAMTLYLDHPNDMARPYKDFERRIMPDLVAMKRVTSIFGGTPHRDTVHFVLRVDCEVGELFDLIEQIHGFAVREGLFITTNTYVIVKKWSSLSLEKQLSIPERRRSEESYRNSHLFPLLSRETRIEFGRLDEDAQRSVVDLFQVAERAMNDLRDLEEIRGKIPRFVTAVAEGLVLKDYLGMVSAHHHLQAATEVRLDGIIGRFLGEEFLEKFRKSLNIHSGKDLERLTYTEKIKLSIRGVKEGAIETGVLTSLTSLYADTVGVRNAMAHGRHDELSRESFARALITYSRFVLTEM